jgi:hypothetical protein
MYRQISDFAPDINNQVTSDPLLYCVLDTMDSQFLHGAPGRTFGKYNEHCSEYLSTRCSMNWDGVCEAMSKDRETRFPNTGGPLPSYGFFGNYKSGPCLPYGEQIIRDTAFKKYKVKLSDCNVYCEPFDPTVANSPLVCYEARTSCSTGPTNYEVCEGSSEGGLCQSVYKFTPEQIQNLDSDPVMNKILDKPEIASDLIEQIYLTMKDDGSLNSLKGTRFYRYLQYVGCQL